MHTYIHVVRADPFMSGGGEERRIIKKIDTPPPPLPEITSSLKG